jgi:hypothetical protein
MSRIGKLIEIRHVFFAAKTNSTIPDSMTFSEFLLFWELEGIKDRLERIANSNSKSYED